jgi:Transglutaminase-like superfamily
MTKTATESARTDSANKFTLLVLLVCGFCSSCSRPEPLALDVQKQLVSMPDELPKSTTDSAEKKNTESATESESTTGSASPKEEIVVERFLVNDVDWINLDQLPWNYAEVQYVENTRIGYSTVKVSRSELTERLLRILREDVIERAIDGSPAPQRRVTLELFEKPNGDLASFRFDSKVEGVNDLVVEGRVNFNDLHVTKREGKNQPLRTKMPWKRDNWGPFGIQSVLMRSPMKPGEVRAAQIFIPQLAQFVPVTFEARGMEITPLVQGKSQELMLIDLTIGTPADGMLTSLFVDNKGVILKSITRSGQLMSAFQVPIEIVQRIADQSEFLRGMAHQLTVTGDASPLPTASSAQYAIEAEDVDPYDSLIGNSRQKLRSISPDRVELTISVPDADAFDAVDINRPDATLLESSLLIPTEKEQIKSLSAELLSDRTTEGDRQKAEALRLAVHQSWKLQPIGGQIGSTLVAARERTGSCIEVSHLMAALLRHEKIPARIVFGLAINAAKGSAQFHVWNQAWLDEQWRDLDATIPGGIGVAHIAMSISAGAGQNPYADYLKILNRLSKFRRLEILNSGGDQGL